MTTFNVSYEEFKRESKVFFDNLPSLNEDQRNAAYKALMLLYVGLNTDTTELELHQAVIVLKIASKKVIELEMPDNVC